MSSGCRSSQEKEEQSKTVDVNAIMNAGYAQGMKETAEQIRDIYQREGGYYGSKQHAVPVMTNPRAAAWWIPPTLYREVDGIAQGRWFDIKIKDSDWFMARRHELDPYHLVHFRVKQRERVDYHYKKEQNRMMKSGGGYPYPVTLNKQQRESVQQSREQQQEQAYRRASGPMPGPGETIEFSR